MVYVNSTFLSGYFNPEVVTALFVIGPLLNIFLFFYASRIVELVGKGKFLFLLTLITFISTATLYFSTSWFNLGVAFIAYQGSLLLIYWCLDLYLADGGAERYAGELRGIFLTLVNAGIAFGPLLVTLLNINQNLRPIYLVASLITVVPLLMSFERSLEPNHKQVPIHLRHHPVHLLPFAEWWRRRDVRAITLVRLTLEIFFGTMIVYVPIYLHNALGLTWGELGIIFTSMLVPFVLIEWPAGKLADKLWGEKEMLASGLFITGASLLAMPFIGASFFAWLVVLVVSRIGASLIEVNSESYFFKKITKSEIRMISLFRIVKPFGYILGTILGLIISTQFAFTTIFFVLAVIIFMGLKESLSLVDTR